MLYQVILTPQADADLPLSFRSSTDKAKAPRSTRGLEIDTERCPSLLMIIHGVGLSSGFHCNRVTSESEGVEP